MARSASRCAAIAGALALVARGAAAQQGGAAAAAPPARVPVTWVVDDDGPGNFADLPEATLAASDGDTLVLRPGRYRAATIHGKGLRIVGAGAAATFIEQRDAEGPFLSVSDLGSDQLLVVGNLTGIGRGRSLELARLRGITVLADLVIDGRDGACGPRLDYCANVTVARVAVLPSASPLATPDAFSVAHGRCSLTQVVALGSPGASAKSPRGRARSGGHGLAVVDADVEAALCEWVGGTGGSAEWDLLGPFCPEAAVAGAGGCAVALAGRSTLRLAGDGRQQLQGGAGGDAKRNPWEECWSFAGDGGAGLRLGSGVDPLRIAASGVVRSGGPAGAGQAPRAGRPGLELDPEEPPIEPIAPAWPTLSFDTVAPVGGVVRLRVLGTPGDRVTLLIGQQIEALPLKKTDGFRLHVVGEGTITLPQSAPIGPDGTLLITAEMPRDASFVGQHFAAQALLSRRNLGSRDNFATNVDVVVIGDGSSREPAGVSKR